MAYGSYNQWVSDAGDGPCNSILREVTVASWIVGVPESGAPELMLRFTSPSLDFQRYRVAPTPEFWSAPTKSLQPATVSFSSISIEPVGSEQQYTDTTREN